jgi:hypothetical protein
MAALCAAITLLGFESIPRMIVAGLARRYHSCFSKGSAEHCL